MPKQKDMGKAHWLSKPALVGRLSLPSPGTTGPQKPESRAPTLIFHPPKKTLLSSPWGRP